LRRTPDPAIAGLTAMNIAPREKMNNYVYTSDAFKDWISRLLHQLTLIEYPIYIHCTAGKDRTGVATALLLKLLGIANEHILEDYLRSEGTTHVDSLQAILDDYVFEPEILDSKALLDSIFLVRSGT
jgi:protein-tyrosine phosphatase